MIAMLGPHAGFILASYVAAALVIAGLVLWVVIDHARLNRALADLERRGVRRRSAGRDATGPSGAVTPAIGEKAS